MNIEKNTIDFTKNPLPNLLKMIESLDIDQNDKDEMIKLSHAVFIYGVLQTIMKNSIFIRENVIIADPNDLEEPAILNSERGKMFMERYAEQMCNKQITEYMKNKKL